MAIKSTIYKADIDIVDTDRHYYQNHKITVACHPSENEARLMVRILVFALNAHERLVFGKGISDSDEPDLWQKNLTGDIENWIELGHPDERILVRACGRSSKVMVYTYQTNPERWWDTIKTRFQKERKLQVWHIQAQSAEALALLAERTMSLQVSIQDGDIWLRNTSGAEVQVILERSN